MTPNSPRIRRVVTVALLLVLAGCDDDAPSGGGLELNRTCAQTVCDHCTMSGVARDSRECAAACSGTPVCLNYSVAFDVLGSADPDLEKVCLDYAASVARCGQSIPDTRDRCRRYATLEDPHPATEAYQCASSLPCGASASEASSCEPAPRHGLSEWYCQKAVAEGAASCDPEMRARVGHADGWLRERTADAVKSCATELGDDVEFESCVASWLAAVEGDDD